jgi:hypothetical protein
MADFSLEQVNARSLRAHALVEPAPRSMKVDHRQNALHAPLREVG